MVIDVMFLWFVCAALFRVLGIHFRVMGKVISYLFNSVIYQVILEI